MNGLLWAKIGALLSVLYALTNVYQLLVSLEQIRERIQDFTKVAGDLENANRLQAIRGLFYFGLPLAFMAVLMAAKVPFLFLALVAIKFWLSAGLGLWTEKRLLKGNTYGITDHRLYRLDAFLNLAVAFLVMGLLAQLRY